MWGGVEPSRQMTSMMEAEEEGEGGRPITTREGGRVPPSSPPSTIWGPSPGLARQVGQESILPNLNAQHIFLYSEEYFFSSIFGPGDCDLSSTLAIRSRFSYFGSSTL